MDLDAALRAVAPDAPDSAVEELAIARPQLETIDVLANANRVAHLFGQCAHESGGFLRLVESLFYSSGARIFAVFGRRHFRDIAHAEEFARNQEKLANHVYANRMENGAPDSGDGFRFRGRGYLQLTGRQNYRIFGDRIGIDLVTEPERAAEPNVAWLIAGTYLANRSRADRTALEWADDDNVEMVTRIVNGGINGLHERRSLTARAQEALGMIKEHPLLRRGDEGPAVERLQTLLAAADFSPGAIDGDFGPKTEAALKRFQAAADLPENGVADDAVWAALET